jgi:hypothetical protein
MSDTTKDAVRKTNSLFPSAQNRFFYTDPSGDGSRFFSTETERDAAMKEAIAAWCDEGWSEEVDQIFSGVVTHTVEKCDVQTKPQPCAAHPDHDYGDNDCEACIAWDEFPNHEFDEVCNYKPVALLAPAQVQAEAVQQIVYPAEFTEDLQWILGLGCFQCITYAQALRRSGRDIPNKAEAEQAATLDWMLRHYLRDPVHWRKTASDDMREMDTAPSTGDQS